MITVDHTEKVAEAAKQISTLKAREDEQKKRRQSAEEETDKIRKARGVAAAFTSMGDHISKPYDDTVSDTPPPVHRVSTIVASEVVILGPFPGNEPLEVVIQVPPRLKQEYTYRPPLRQTRILAWRATTCALRSLTILPTPLPSSPPLPHGRTEEGAFLRTGI